jgi:hypothetical protein
MSTNLDNFLNGLGLSIEGYSPCGVHSPVGWCSIQCIFSSCHGLTNAQNWCPNGDCSMPKCNLNANNWHQPDHCYIVSCDTRHMNSSGG